jgi:glycerol-3-phosphate acyltransferase PlsY
LRGEAGRELVYRAVMMVVGRRAARVPARVVAAAGVGYLLGTVSSADLVARTVSGGTVDLREEGSGNPGTVNVAGVLGAKAGAVVLAGDVTKAAVASAVGRAIAGPVGAHVAGSAAVVGHCHPVWTRFRGGKGVAASVGQCLMTFPAYFPVDAVVAGLTVALPAWRKRAFGSMVVSSICWVTGGVIWWRRDWRNAWGPKPSPALPIAALVSSAVIIGRFIAEASGEQASGAVGK